jgi:hypothetical protein
MAKFTYETLDDDGDDLENAEALHHRENEHRQYARNEAVFAALLDDMVALNLPDEWPQELKKHRNKSRDQIIADIEDEVTELLVLNLAQRDMLRRRMRAERHERKNIETYIGQIKKSLPKDMVKRAAVLDAAKVKRDAEKVKG